MARSLAALDRTAPAPSYEVSRVAKVQDAGGEGTRRRSGETLPRGRLQQRDGTGKDEDDLAGV